MADPHHIEPLDGFDRLTVRAYRAGLLLAPVALGWLAVEPQAAHARWLATAAIALSVVHLHLYDRKIRWVIQGLTAAGLAISAAPTADPTVLALGHGLLLAALSALVLKEWFCFRIPLVRLTPLTLAAAVTLAWGDALPAAQIAYGLGALGVALIAVAKLRMPLTHDIGDRSRYQV